MSVFVHAFPWNIRALYFNYVKIQVKKECRMRMNSKIIRIRMLE